MPHKITPVPLLGAGGGGASAVFILPSFISPSLCKFLPFVLLLFAPPSFFLSLFYLFFLTGCGLQLIFDILVIVESSVRFPNLNFRSPLLSF